MTEGEQVARRFHALHEDRFAKTRRESQEPVPWDDMPDSYQQRLVGTFDVMLKEGAIVQGAFLNFLVNPEQIPASF